MPARALAAMATIRTPGVERASATDLAPPRRRRSVWRSTRSADPTRASSRMRAGRATDRSNPYWTIPPTMLAKHDRDERHQRVEVAPLGRDARPDDDEIAGHRDRQAGLLDQDQAGDRQDGRGIGRHQASSGSIRKLGPPLQTSNGASSVADVSSGKTSLSR